MLEAPVPKTSVDENSDLLFGKRNVDRSLGFSDTTILHSKSKTHFKER
jgi:hypothetical protein